MKTNDGQKIPGSNFVRGMEDKGPLGPKDALDNSMMFEKSPTGNNGVIQGMESWQKETNLDDPGFDASGNCWYKFGTPYGEKAMFNQLPPGPDITDQDYILINEMPLKRVTMMGYPGDGAFPTRDIPEN
jgi:hypothetical protein